MSESHFVLRERLHGFFYKKIGNEMLLVEFLYVSLLGNGISFAIWQSIQVLFAFRVADFLYLSRFLLGQMLLDNVLAFFVDAFVQVLHFFMVLGYFMREFLGFVTHTVTLAQVL